MIKTTFQTIAYKQGFILINCSKSEITGSYREDVSYCPFDGYGSFQCKSVHAAKILITKAHKQD